MSERFADTFYYIALLNRRDRMHARAVESTREHTGKMVTTTAVLTELADGVAGTAQRRGFAGFLAGLQTDPDVIIVPADLDLFQRGAMLYSQRGDKDWSLTDCISFVVMRERGITEALTGDHHFEQAGFTILLK